MMLYPSGHITWGYAPLSILNLTLHGTVFARSLL